MFVMASPLEAHLTETLTSLKFATKVRLLDPFQESNLTPSRYITHISAQQRSQRKFVNAAVISDLARDVAWYRESNILVGVSSIENPPMRNEPSTIEECKWRMFGYTSDRVMLLLLYS
jgi:hypothetical protein